MLHYLRKKRLSSAIASLFGDPYYNLNSLLVRARQDSQTGETNTKVVDSGPLATLLTVTGSPTQQKGMSPYGIGPSAYFDSASYLAFEASDVMNFGTGDFTIEYWEYLTNTSTYSRGFGMVLPTGYFGIEASTAVIAVGLDDASHVTWGTLPALATNTWYHIALTRKNGVCTLFINGVATASETFFNDISPAVGTQAFICSNAYCLLGYMADFRIVKGNAVYTANFVPPTEPLQAIAGTSLLVNFDNAKVQDTTNKNNISLLGTPQTSTDVTNLSNASLYFNGSSYITAVNKAPLAKEDFTIEAWVYPTSFTGSPVIIDYRPAVNGLYPTLYINTTGNLIYYTNTAVLITSTQRIKLNRWTHVALCRMGGNLRMFIDGMQVNSLVADANNYSALATATIGRSGLSATSFFNGYMDDVRVTQGVARYRVDFIVDNQYTSAQDPYYTSSIALTTNEVAGAINTSFVDSSSNGFAVTSTGTVSQGTFAPNAAGTALYFDRAAASYLNIAINGNAAAAMAGDFTIEQWVYPTSYASSTALLNDSRANSVGNYWTDSITSAGIYRVYINGAQLLVSTATVPLNAWTHIAAVRSDGVLYVYFNGVLDSSAALTATIIPCTGTMTYGVSNMTGQLTAAYAFAGYATDIRHVNGTAVYTANFTPPSAPLTAIPGTFLLLQGANAGVFDACDSVPVFLGGGAKVSTAAGKYSKGIVLNGSTDYAYMKSNPKLLFGANDFTIEAWVYPTATKNQAIYSDCTAATANGSLYIALDTNNKVSVQWFTAAATLSTAVVTTAAVALNTWNHVSVCKRGIYMYASVNGVVTQLTTAALATLLTPTAGSFNIGGILTSKYFAGTIEDFRVTFGVAKYVATFAVPNAKLISVVRALPTDLTKRFPTTPLLSAGDAYYDRTSVLLHMNGQEGSTNFADQRGNLVTVNGSVKLTTVDKKFGVSCGSFVATSSLQVPAAASILGTSDFTVEAFIKPIAFASGFQTWFSNDTTSGFSLTLNSSGTIGVGRALVGTDNVSAGGVGKAVVFGEWNHVVVCRESGMMQVYVNGVRTLNIANNTSFVSGIIRIGTDSGGTNYPYIGYMDEIRVTLGACRYSANFTPPNVPFADFQSLTSDFAQGTSLIVANPPTANNRTIIDSSSNAFTPVVTNVSQVGSGPYAPNGWSVAFKNNDCLQTATGSALDMGTADFTAEAWVNLTTTGTAPQCIFGQINSTYAYLAYNGSNGSWCMAINAGAVVDFANAPAKLGRWQHVAVCRVGNTFNLYLDGKFRSSITSTASFGYPNFAMTIGATGPAENFLIGNIANLRIVKGTALYTADFTPSTAKLTAVAGTTFLGCQTNTFEDLSGAAYAVTIGAGTPAVSTDSPAANTLYMPGSQGGALTFEGTATSYIQIANNASLDLGVGDFTLETWVYVNSRTNTNIITRQSSTGLSGIQWAVNLSSIGVLTLSGSDGNSAYTYFATSIPVIKAGQWQHLAIVRSGGVWGVYANGTSISLTSAPGYNYSMETNVTGAPLFVGGFPAYSPLAGMLADVRFTKSAVYTANFARPVAPLEALPSTQLLLKGANAAVYDAFGKVPVTTVGNAKVARLRKYVPGIEFDGTNSYAYFAGNTCNTAFGIADFTVEMWVKPNSLTGTQVLFDSRPFGTAATNNYFTLNLVSGVPTYNTAATSAIQGVALVVGVWYHIAVCRRDRSTKMFVNGWQVGSIYADSQSYICGANRPLIGVAANTLTANWLSGTVEQVRVTRGVARYIANFIPPLAKFPTT